MDVVSVDSAKKNPQLIPKTSTSSTKALERWEDKHVRLLFASYMKFKDEFEKSHITQQSIWSDFLRTALHYLNTWNRLPF